MIPYLFILLLFFIGLKYKTKSNEYVYFVLCGVLLLLLTSLRDVNVGIDTLHYRYEFIDKYERPLEPLWVLFRNGIRTITVDFQLFLTIVAVSTLLPIFLFFKHESKYILLSLFIFYILPSDMGYVMTLNQIRQAFALSIILWFYIVFKQKKWIFSILLGLGAFFIHNTAIIPIVGVLLVQTFDINKRIFIPLLSVLSLLAFSSFNFSQFFSLIEETSLMEIEFIEKKSSYADYLSAEFSLSFFGTILLIGPPIILSILICLNHDKCPKLYAKLYLIGTIFICLFAQVPMIKRYVSYFLVLETVLFPYLWNIPDQKYNKIICKSLIALQVLNFVLYLYFCNKMGLNSIYSREIAPYHFFFEQ